MTGTRNVVAAVFKDNAAAEAAVEAVRAHGITDEAIGVVAATPGHYLLPDHSAEEAFTGAAEGIALGAPAGALAGLALMGLVVPVTAGVGGLLIGAGTGAVWGTFLGGLGGFTARLRANDDDPAEFCDIPVSGGQVLVVVHAGDKAGKVRWTMRQHGSRCFIEEAMLEKAAA